MMGKAMLKVWGRANSMCVQKVLWCCGEIGLQFARVDIGGHFGGNRSPEYLALNPNGVVPTLDDDGFILWESNAIVRYLAAKYDPDGLVPIDPAGRADAERWMDWQINAMAPWMPTIFLGLVRTPAERRDHHAIDAARAEVAKALAILEAHLAKHDYVSGSRLTVGDIPVGISVWRFFQLPVERPAFPHIDAWQRRLEERAPFRAHVMGPLH
jgi:glutathione S-transferase